MEIGDALTVISTPVQSHLVTGPVGRLVIGRDVRIAHGAAIAAHHEVLIGDRVVLGPYVIIMDTDFHAVGDRDAPAPTAPIHIGDDVRIDARVTILRGSRIGAGARVLAGSVVAGVVPAGATVTGVPARGASTEAPATGAVPRPTETAIRAVVRRTLGMAQEPAMTDGPDTVEAWDSLGMLNLLLSLEGAFGLSIRPEAMLAVRSVADLCVVVTDAATAAATAPATASATASAGG